MSRSTPDRCTQEKGVLFTRVNCNFDFRGRYNQRRGTAGALHSPVSKFGEWLGVIITIPLYLELLESSNLHPCLSYKWTYATILNTRFVAIIHSNRANLGIYASFQGFGSWKQNWPKPNHFVRHVYKTICDPLITPCVKLQFSWCRLVLFGYSNIQVKRSVTLKYGSFVMIAFVYPSIQFNETNSLLVGAWKSGMWLDN